MLQTELAHFDHLKWPTVGRTDYSVLEVNRSGGSGGLESQGGAARGDSARVRVWRGDDTGSGEEVGCASAHGPRSLGQCSSGPAEEAGTKAVTAGAGDPFYRYNFAVGSIRPAQAAAHGASDLSAGLLRAVGLRSVKAK